MAQKKPGMMIYFEDYKALRSTLGAEEFVQMMDAMTAYAENGELPDESLLAPAALICWRFMEPKLRRDEEAYCAKKQARSQAAKKRWEMEAAHRAAMEAAGECEDASGEVTGASAQSGQDMQTMQMHDFMPTPTSTPTATPTSKTAAAAPSLSTASAYEDARIEALIFRYRLPDTTASRKALAEDLESVGDEQLEEALDKASLSNSRQMLSVNFYRRFLFEQPPRQSGGSYFDQFERF